ncbi:carbon-nitrogen hydrolase [Schizophyllum amplum]|uniref:Carbon-nitrogen hydrolase n=1 Tax=Schizophyllum amplum TaxID=97359 RepID=A0A550C624_9AGAR|nr:carbon-nitrogen hydrolase [Auriculariopsis ampla]
MTANKKLLRASVVQTCTQEYSVQKTLDKLESLVRVAKDRDSSQLAVFPEAFIGGYPKHSTFGAVVGERSPEGRDEFLRYHSNAIEIPSPEVSRIEVISRDTGVFLVVGVIERDGGTLYCSVIFVDPVHGYLAKHRKLVPTGSERLIWGQGDGTTMPVVGKTFSVKDQGELQTKMSTAICWENYMPLFRQYYYNHGVTIYTAPTVDARPVWQNTMVHIALEGRCFVLSANQFAQEKHYPADHAVRNPEERHEDNVMIGGGSMIVSPLGEILAGPLRGEEGVLTATLDLDDVVRGKFDLDVAGHYARPDVFTFTANTSG